MGCLGYVRQNLFNQLGVFEISSLFLISLTCYGLLAFGYVVGIVGPYETSIRIRLLREFHRIYPRNILFEELRKSYNNKIILDNRLEKFLGSKEVLLRGREYTFGNKPAGVFSVIDLITDLLKKFYKIS